MKYLWLLVCLGLAACGGSSDEGEILQSLYAYDSSSPYSDNIVECVRAYQTDESCYLDALPPISRTSAPITVDQIMSRLVVSHDWMAVRFRQVLEESNTPQAALDLFAPLTAVVISYDIIPAFYTLETGAIYLDPRYLWTTPEEYHTIASKEDYRSGFDDELSILTYHWYEDRAGFSISLDGTPETPVNRTVSAVSQNIMRLLFHELAHANDFLPPDERIAIELPAGETTYYDAVNNAYRADQLVQQQLIQLNDSTLLSLAQVMYDGETASSELKAISASTVGNLFEMEGANDHYAYSTPAEDVAMLLEETLMSYTYEAKRSVLFLDKINPALEADCRGYEIGWGQQGRIADDLVRPRAKQVISAMLPSLASDIHSHLDSLAAPDSYSQGSSFCNNLPSSRSRSYSTRGNQPEAISLPPMEYRPPMRVTF